MRSFAALFLLVAFAAPAQASHFAEQPGSRLQFTTSVDGEEFTGRFETFDASIRFDPADLAGSRFEVRISLNSARTDNEERDEALLGPEFFDSVAKPEAKYVATKFVKLKDGRWRADGTLTLRGVTKPVPLVFSWTPGVQPILAGEAVVNRLDFGVGTGEWGDLELIPDRVVVKTRLVLAARPPPRMPEAEK